MPSIPGVGAIGGLVRFATRRPKGAAATLAGVGAAVGVGVYALVKKRSAGEERSAYEEPHAPEPATGGPDAEAAREIAREPTSPADVPGAEPPTGSRQPASLDD